MEFPRLVYRSAVDYMLVDSQTAFDDSLKAGWFSSVPECGKEPEESGDVSPPTRPEMEEQAKSLGIKFDGRWGDKKLLDAIENAMRRD